jgi:hypothetical protein
VRPEDQRSFTADDPVAQYWLQNCVGFGVRGLRSGPGMVREVSVREDGIAVLGVRRSVLRGTARIPADRVESVNPWDETIVLRSGGSEARERLVAQAHGAAGVVGAAARGATIAAAFGARLFLAAVARLLLAVAALTRRYAPVARRGGRRVAGTLGFLGRAYAAAAADALRAQKDAVAAWQEERRRGAWGDESAPTRAGADDVDARSKERIRS